VNNGLQQNVYLSSAAFSKAHRLAELSARLASFVSGGASVLTHLGFSSSGYPEDYTLLFGPRFIFLTCFQLASIELLRPSTSHATPLPAKQNLRENVSKHCIRASPTR